MSAGARKLLLYGSLAILALAALCVAIGLATMPRHDRFLVWGIGGLFVGVFLFMAERITSEGTSQSEQ